MSKPVIGLTCHSLPSSLGRSAVVQLYLDAVLDAGGAPLAIPIGLDPDSMHAVYERIDGLLLPGGDDVGPERYGHERHPMLGAVDPQRDELEITVAGWALRDHMPLLGICRGIQVLAVAAGGTLYQDIASEWETNQDHDVRDFGRDHLCHTLSIEPRSLLAQSIGCASSRVNSFHHQSVREVPPGFCVSARSDDGIIEGIETIDGSFVVGVQCHPEGLWQTTGPHFRGLFASFVDAARQYATGRGVQRSA